MSKQNHPENFNETLKLTDDLANVNGAYNLAKQLTADCPQFEFVRSRKQLASYACIAQSKHCNISKQPHWTFCLSDTRYQYKKKNKTRLVAFHHDENQEHKKVQRP